MGVPQVFGYIKLIYKVSNPDLTINGRKKSITSCQGQIVPVTINV